MKYWEKMRGKGQSPPGVSLSEVFWSWLGAFSGIALVALLHYKLLDQLGMQLLMASLGASAVLLYGAIRSPLAQPRNVLGGHVLSAIVGVSAYQLLGAYQPVEKLTSQGIIGKLNSRLIFLRRLS